MAMIVPRRVAGFNRDQLLNRSIVKFLDFRGRNSPFRANPWESCDHKGKLSGLPSFYALP